MGIAEIDAMSHAERVETMELLWDAISRNEEECKSPDWHKDVLSERRRRLENGEAQFYTLEEAEGIVKNA